MHLLTAEIVKYALELNQLIEDYLEKNAETLEKIDITELILPEGLSSEDVIRYIQQKKVEGLSEAQLDSIIKLHAIPCPNCGAINWTSVRKFNLLFPIKLGIVEGEQSLAYLRGETAQGMFY
ncbi:MAG: hypothetical protein KatS3mg035_2132 [Bacteroidia bacterium]|nr:MAG: hypothetical protein KatS3mg035_2132 [Bacteroidia bacterium]